MVDYVHAIPPDLNPSNTPKNDPPGVNAVAGEHALSIRSCAFFPYRSEHRDEQLEPAEEGKRAWSNVLNALRDLAEPEDWTGTEPLDTPLPILDSYLRYTHQRLVTEDKIAESRNANYAALNTGLLTPFAEEIFGLFARNTREGAQRWFFLRWATESDRDLLREFDGPPPMAEYVSSASDLVYDWRRELKLDYSHILSDHIDRFPDELASQPAKAKQALDSAVAWALRKARRNYKVIVPQ